ncbi:MAG: MGMT family protein [Nanoarchaeota archaeon]|nr:MGMT family protein [Nanoarchaeota archaeon]MBU1269648.1 MGMT family protein [Nanoarchaeota archaeon]MBU1605081.1 MGMT family protein [Nanoarchaeota archaeon]MBU2443233.1 MGMT family protein [Nanoarchaeota archaeon]
MPTSFEEKIYSLLRQVPRGRVTTYGELAKAAKTKAYRAVGRAMKSNPYSFVRMDAKNQNDSRAKNPYAPIVPCHRVVKSNGEIGGFAHGIKKKIEILKKEGVIVKNNKVVDFEKLLFSKDKFK